MAYMITEDCIACESVCPNGATRKRNGDAHIIEPESCTEYVGFPAKLQCSLVRAFAACVPDPSRQESGEELLIKFHRLHLGQAPVVWTTRWPPARKVRAAKI